MAIYLRKYVWLILLLVVVAALSLLLGWGLGMTLFSAPRSPAPPEGLALAVLFLLLAGGAIGADRWGARRSHARRKQWRWISYLLIVLLIALVGWWLLRSSNAFGPQDPFHIRY